MTRASIRNASWGIFLAFAAAFAACKSSQPPPQTPESESASERSRDAVPRDPGEEAHPITGALSEEAFKELHERSRDEVPPRRGEVIELEVGETPIRAYLSLPEDASAPVPGIVVIHEWWGLNENIQHWSDRLAGLGYAALAVDLYGGEVAEDPEGAMELVESVDEERALAILRKAHRFLETDERIRAPRTASIGWCFGGGYSLELALAEPELDAAVMYYGSVVTDEDALADIEASLLGIFGEQDESIPPEDVEAFEESLDRAGVEHAIHSYDAGHAFANPSGDRYDEDAAAAAWEEVRSFLAEELAR